MIELNDHMYEVVWLDFKYSFNIVLKDVIRLVVEVGLSL